MKTQGFSTQCRVHHCSQCPGDTEFYCMTCKHSLCLNCKERHVMSLDTLYHDVVMYREKFKCFLKEEACVRHPGRIYEMYCQSCKLPVCRHCKIHRKHKILNIKTAYKTNRQQHREIIHNIRSELLYNICFLLAKIHSDIKILRKDISDHQSLMSSKAQRFKDLIDDVICDVKIKYNHFLIHRLLKQRTRMKRHLTIVESYDQKTEQSINRPVEFLSFIKNIPSIKTKGTCILTKQALSTEVNTEDLIQELGEIQNIDRTGKRKVESECLLKLMPTPVLQKSVTVRGISFVNHISMVTSERVWVSDHDDIYLTNTVGDVM
ncbi:E3 ubiquitin-protein ligase TRIM45-like [Saccostrea echinata]|uniref:E3 ubiquitin-protein ligase TRIM45-like n=1 Tax=Saccostrea echinata TaxID=191078 RepID=UPI002A810FCA|nr:E3 ubiquitin-protein ligase TRIM45-like [Saccostrea echinata]